MYFYPKGEYFKNKQAASNPYEKKVQSNNDPNNNVTDQIFSCTEMYDGLSTVIIKNEHPSFEATEEFVCPAVTIVEQNQAVMKLDSSWKDLEANEDSDCENILRTRDESSILSSIFISDKTTTSLQMDKRNENSSTELEKRIMTRRQPKLLEYFSSINNSSSVMNDSSTDPLSDSANYDRFEKSVSPELIGKSVDTRVEELSTNETESDSSTSDAEPGLNKILTDFRSLMNLYCTKCNRRTNDFVYATAAKKCEKCGKIFVYECLKCHGKYKFYTGLKRHLDKKCFPKRIFSCRKCFYKTKSIINMDKHVKSHLKNDFKMNDDKNQVDDRIIDSLIQVLPDSNDLSIHSTNEKPNKLNRLMVQYCPKCNEGTNYNDYYTGKIGNCHKCKTPMLLQCRKCTKRFGQYKLICWHLQYRCNRSVITYANETTATVNDNKKNTKCYRCGKKFKTLGNLKMHQKFCQKFTYLCKFCPYEVDMKTKLVDHMRLHKKYGYETVRENNRNQNDNSEIVEAYCTNCSKSRNVPNYFSICQNCKIPLSYRCLKCNPHYSGKNYGCCHVNRHLKTLIHKCSNCDNGFSHVENLMAHMKVCLQKPLFQCDNCSFSTKNKEDLEENIHVCENNNV